MKKYVNILLLFGDKLLKGKKKPFRWDTYEKQVAKSQN